jgi:hypothetical protein
MPAKKPAKAPPPEERYPAIEELIETASASELPELFQPLRQALEELRGPRKEHAKRVLSALDRTDELLQMLVQTREKLISQGKGRR